MRQIVLSRKYKNFIKDWINSVELRKLKLALHHFQNKCLKCGIQYLPLFNYLCYFRR